MPFSRHPRYGPWAIRLGKSLEYGGYLCDKNKVLIWIGTVIVVYLGFWTIGVDEQGEIDPWLALTIGLTFQTVVTVMLFFTNRWSWRAVGAMSCHQGIAILYAGSAIITWNPGLQANYAEPLSDMGRAFLIVGAMPLLFGAIRYSVAVIRTGRKHVTTDSIDM